MNKKKIIAVIAVMALAVGMISGCGCKKKDIPADVAENTETAKKENPTFMYYISNSDEDFDKTNETLKELEEEYKDRVNFKIINIDDDNVQALVTQGQTPTLILTNGTDGEAQIKNQCNDKEELKNCIEEALK